MKKINRIIFLTFTIAIFVLSVIRANAEDTTTHPITEKVNTIYYSQDKMNLNGVHSDSIHKDEALPVNENGRPIYSFGVGCPSSNPDCIPEENAEYDGIIDSIEVDGETFTIEDIAAAWNTQSNRWQLNGMNDGNPTIAVNSAKENYSVRYNNVGTFNNESIDIKMILVDFDLIDADSSNRRSYSGISFYKTRIGVAVTGVKWVKVRFEFYEHGTDTLKYIKGNTTFWDVDQNQGVIIPMYVEETTTNGAVGIYYKSAGRKCKAQAAWNDCEATIEYNSCELEDVDNQLYLSTFNGYSIGESLPKNYFFIYDYNSGIHDSECNNNLYNDHYGSTAFAFTELFEGDKFESIFTYSNPSYYSAGNYMWNGHGSIELSSETVTNKYTITATVDNGKISIDDQNFGSAGGSVEVDEGVDSIVTYEPNTGYALYKITVNGEEVSKDNFLTSYPFLNVDKNNTIHVEYKKVYNITTEVEPTNCATITESSTVIEGENKIISYGTKPNCEGYYLKEVKVDGSNVNIETYPDSYEFPNVDRNHTIRVVYLKSPDSPSKTANQANKALVKLTDEVVFEISQKVEPNQGTKFKNLIFEDVLDAAFVINRNKISVKDKNNVDVTSKFDITVNGQKVTASAKSTALNDNSFYDNTYTLVIIVTIDEEIDIDYYNIGDEDNSILIKNKATVTVDDYSSDTLEVAVEIKKHIIRTSAVNGEIDPTPYVVVPEGNNELIFYEPIDDNILVKILVDGEEVEITDENKEYYYFPNVTEDHEIEVIYDRSYTITTEVENGEIDPTPSVNVKNGDDVTITYKPKKGYELSEIIIDGESIDIKDYKDSYTFLEVDKNHTIKVIYINSPKTGIVEVGGLFLFALAAFVVYRFVIAKKQINEI